MKNLATSYTYNPTAKTLTLTGLNVPLSYLLLVVNATRGTIIYNLADPALAAANYTQGANSVLTLNASVDTSFHAPSDALTIFYDDGVQTNTLLLQGPAGPKGDQGDPGSTTWDGITDKPATFAPTSHKSTHATGGSDAIAPNEISAAWALVLSSQTITGDTLLSAGRNRRIRVGSTSSITANIDLPWENNQAGDVVTLVGAIIGPPLIGTFTIRSAAQIGGGAPLGYSTLATINAIGQSFTFISSGTATGWSLITHTHTHAIADTTGLQSALDAKASTSALAALEARVLALEAAQP